MIEVLGAGKKAADDPIFVWIMLSPFLLLIGFFVLNRIYHAVTVWRDRKRIRRYIEARGGRVHSVEWWRFERGFLVSSGERVYKVRYADERGFEHQARSKTTARSGVFFSDDQIINSDREPADQLEVLERENRRLREELEAWKSGRAGW